MSKTKIVVNPRIYFQKQNEVYNKEVDSIIDDIFQINKINQEEYILVGDYIYEQIKEFTPFTERQRAISTYNNYNDIKSPIIQNSTKAYENLVAHLMLDGKYNTYVIAGGMGTGKTSACNFIVNLLVNRLNKKGNFIINIRFDFNGVIDGTEDEIVRFFKRKLYDQLVYKIEDYLIENENALDDFCAILNDRSRREPFGEFRNFNCYKEISWIENTITHEEKINKFFHYIDGYEDKLMPLMQLVYHIAHHYEGNSVILVFDNIDSLLPNCQRRILLNVFKYNTTAQIKCFIPLRRATFKRTLKELEKDRNITGSFPYGFIHHHGAEPLRVVLERTRSFLKNHDNYKILKSIHPQYKDSIIARFEEFKLFLEKDNTFSRFFSQISGRSSRLALSISRRFFVNNVIEYSNQKIQYDLGIKAFMVAENPNYLFDNTNESEIANVLCCNIYSDFSFLPYLILSYVDNAKEIEEYEIRFIYKKVSASINTILKKDEFLSILNNILIVRRPLLWSDDKSYYDNDTDLEECVNTLEFTELGKGYFEIINHNTQYLQECLMSLRWSHDYVPQQFDSFKLSERFAFIRKCILEIVNQEVQYIKYESKIRPLSTILFTTIGNYFAYILLNNESLLMSQDDEILNWKSLRTELYNIYNYDPNSSEKISKLLERY